MLPGEKTKDAFSKLARGERPAGVSDARLKAHPAVAETAKQLVKVVPTWDYDSMRSQLSERGALPDELHAFDRILEWGQKRGHCQFQVAKNSSLVITIPTCNNDVQILCLQGRKLRFYWGHFVGGYPFGSKKFPHAFELADKYCRELNAAFGWDLQVTKEGGGFYEPSKPLFEVSPGGRINALLEILNRIADEALIDPTRLA